MAALAGLCESLIIGAKSSGSSVPVMADAIGVMAGLAVAVTVGRADIDYVITEYGVAQLKGKSLSERAGELIAIAHPKFRDELKQACQKANS